MTAEPTGYVLTEAIDAPPMMHLNPTAETQCGGRTWNPDDPTISGSDIAYQQVDEKTALSMLDAALAVPCQRCGLKDRPDTEQTALVTKGGEG
jgi:hypothetical protein